MQLKQSFVLLALASVLYGSPAPPSPSPVVSVDVKAKLESINAEIIANSNSTSSLAKRSVHCQTSAGSPYTPNAQSAAAYLQGLGTQSCCQTDYDGSYCTTMWTYGS
ncbi:hypothetical protein C8F01DRAFT_1351940 [Mycena amicta]|nr:hypothetical protein C8F01DRAFT_1351940 [Mycena amicta]